MARRGFMDLLVIPWGRQDRRYRSLPAFAFELYRRWYIGLRSVHAPSASHNCSGVARKF